MFSAHRFTSELPTERLCETAGELPILGKTLTEMQDWAVKLNGGSWATDGQAQLWIREDVYVSHQAIAVFVAAVHGKEGDYQWRAEGAAGNFAEEIAFCDQVPMLVWLSTAGEYDSERLSKAEVLEVDVKTYPIAMPAPQSDSGVQLVSLPLTDAVVIPMAHWSQTLWANLLGLVPYLWRELVGSNVVTMIWRLGLAMVMTLSKDPAKLIRQFVRRGKGCKIHPTAVVEGCILGDGVKIGANAVVRGSVLRDGVRVEELAIVEGSVLSAGAVVQRQAMVKYAVLDESASVAGVVQLGVLGVQSSVKRGGYLMDMNFAGPVQVLKNGDPLNAPLGLIGCGVGEGTTIGLGVAVAAGRWVPPNVKVIMNPDQMLRSTKLDGKCIQDDDSKQVVAVKQGKLRGLDVR